MSSISKPLRPRIEFASALRLGAEIRRRRTALGLSQTDLAQPFTRGFVSAVENGQCVPSLSALLLMAERLNTTAADLLGSVNPRLSRLYTESRATGQGHQKQI